MNIEITPKESTGVDRHVQVSVPVETVKDAEDKAARRYASSVRLPGFRPGKAPATMVRKKFADAIRQEALEALVRDAYKEVIESQDLKVASQPHVHDLKFEEGGPLTFEIHFELRPTLELSRISGFRVSRRTIAVTEDLVREQIETIRDQRAAWAPVDGKPLPGDMVNVAISTGTDGCRRRTTASDLVQGSATTSESSPGDRSMPAGSDGNAMARENVIVSTARTAI